MQPDKERIEHLSVKTGFRVNALEKVIRLTDILNDIFKHPFLSDVFVLKGGTALNLFFGPPSRLSVDLDFNYIGVTDNTNVSNQPHFQQHRPFLSRFSPLSYMRGLICR